MEFNYEDYVWRDPQTIHEYGITSDQLEDENQYMKTAIDNFRETRDATSKPSVTTQEKADDNVKIGEDVGIFATTDVTMPLPDTVTKLLSEPLSFVSEKHKYSSQRQLKVAHNKHGHQGTRMFVKGYNNMPHDNAQLVKNTECFVPTIFIDTVAAHTQFDLDYPKETREHGFMVSCKGVVSYWDETKRIL